MTDRDQRLSRIHDALAEADRALLDALEARARAVRAFGDLRRADPDHWYALPPHEDVVAAARARDVGFPEGVVEAVVREVLAGSEALLAPPRIAYLGPEGSLGNVAARRRFGAAAELCAEPTVRDVLDAVVRGHASHGVVPLESSSEGAHGETLLALTESDARVCGELSVAVTFHLLSRASSLEDVRAVAGSPNALPACERFVASHVPHAEVREVSSSVAAEQAAAADDATAAIVTDVVADRSALPVLRSRIEDRAGIRVRYALVGGAAPARTGSDQTLLALALADAPGSLLSALEPFAERGVNLGRLESRPVVGAPWRSLFFVEVDGHASDRAVVAAIEAVRERSRFTKVLGSYPRPE